MDTLLEGTIDRSTEMTLTAPRSLSGRGSAPDTYIDNEKQTPEQGTHQVVPSFSTDDRSI